MGNYTLVRLYKDACNNYGKLRKSEKEAYQAYQWTNFYTHLSMVLYENNTPAPDWVI